MRHYEPTAVRGAGAAVPTLYEWAGGARGLRAADHGVLREGRCADDLVGPVFAHMDAEHPQHVAMWLAEVFGGPAGYTGERGGYPHMLGKHLGKAITEPQRRRWVNLLSGRRRRGRAARRPGVPRRVRRLHRVGHPAGAGQLPARRRVVRAAPVPHWGWGVAPPYLG